ncbi:MAG: PQQ-binding-like beta-propeller repeat protein [Luteitalea sp.]|nr:PQQ-binding-like beta-propeller repeat protein [Luteitalea sp.]
MAREDRMTPNRSTANRTRLRQATWLAIVIATTALVARPGIGNQEARNGERETGADQWPAYGGDSGGTRYSALAQVTPENVETLRVAWTYRTGELGQDAESGASLTFEATPIHFDGRLYLSTSYAKVIALDPATGAELWTFDAKVDRSADYSEVTSRGVSSWRDPRAQPGAACAARILLGTIDARLIALDARSGQPCAGFGTNGQVSLTQGVHAPSPGDYQVTSPPAILNDLVIVGSSIGDNWNVDTGSGVVRAYDARNGTLRWSWRPIARDTARDGKVGAANAWSIISVDPERDLVFVPTTSPSPDFYGGLRPGTNADASSVVALRGSSGKRVWSFQTVHHDLWDYDIAAQPALVAVTHDGRPVPAVAQATKMGAIFVLDRLTGRPLFPVEERTVPESDVEGETAARTQPFPVRPRLLMPIGPVTPETAWGPTEADRAECRALVSQYRSEGIYTPPGLRGTIMYPGNASGVNWGSVAFDPQRQLLVTNTSRLATLVQLLPREVFERERTQSRTKGEDYEYTLHRGSPFGMRRRTLSSSKHLPCTPPPWGTLAAVDLASGDVRWEVPFGQVPEGHPARALIGEQEIGVPSGGGPLVTAAGLIFIGASMDGAFRAFDIDTGKELWKTKLPRAGVATPMTYEASDGRQMIVIAAGGHGKFDLETGDFVVAFALPPRK